MNGEDFVALGRAELEVGRSVRASRGASMGDLPEGLREVVKKGGFYRRGASHPGEGRAGCRWASMV